MTKCKDKLKEIQVRIPVMKGTARTQELDDKAYSTAQEMSATPIKQFQFLGTGYSAFNTVAAELIYSAFGTPKEES